MRCAALLAVVATAALVTPVHCARGDAITPSVVGGQDAPKNRFKWQVRGIDPC